MEKNTLENYIHNPDRWNMERLDRELEFEVLEEIPEIGSVGRSDKIQLFLLPLLALIIITVVPLILSLTVLRRTETNIDRDFPFTSLESPLLRSAVQEINNKRREVDLKDVQIYRYQERILDLDNRLRLLQELMEETNQIKERDLLVEINNILDEERIRLEGLNRPEEQINQAINKLKTDLDSKYTERMDEFRSQEMMVYEQRMTDLREEKTSLKTALAGAVEERQALAETLDTDESELLAQLYEEKDFIDIVNAGIDADLEILRETRKVENYWLDELSNQYLGLIEAITTRDYNRAGGHLSVLESLFTDSITAELPGIKARNEADREIVRFFSAYLESLEENDNSTLLTESKLLIDLAISHMNAGRYQEADIAWRRVGALWPLMDQVTKGYQNTYRELVAADVRQYSRISESSLASGDFDRASSSWISGLEQIPDPIGRELTRYWQLWESTNTARLEGKDQIALIALAQEKEDAALRYETVRQEMAASAEAERRRLDNRQDALTTENRALNTALVLLEAELIKANRIEAERSTEKLVPEERLTEAEQIISDLERKITDLETRLADIDTSVDTGEIATQWRLYGVIVQVRGEILVIEPLTNQIPPAGSEIRVMRSLGKDRVIHLADGSILEANATRATSRLSSVSSGAQNYGSPEIDDLVYVVTP